MLDVATTKDICIHCFSDASEQPLFTEETGSPSVAKNPGPLTLHPAFFLFSPLGVFYFTIEGLLVIAMSSAPRRVPGTYLVLNKCFSSERVQQGIGRNRPAQSPPL